MSVKKSLPVLAAALSLMPALARADKLDKDAKAWLEQVRPIMLVEEEKTFRALTDKAERAEFQKIFWARRDPDLKTPENEYRVQYEKTRADADVRFKSAGTAGSLTDCGRVFILLGPADDMKDTAEKKTWIFKDRPGLTFKGGQMTIEFDPACALPQGAGLAPQLNQLAESKIVQPSLQYPMRAGKLVPLADQLPKDTPAQALIKSPRQDFATAMQPVMFLRAPGSTYVAGLVHGDLKGASRVTLVAHTTDASGVATTVGEREAVVEATPDGFVVAYGLNLKPGTYDVKIAVLDNASKKGSVATAKVTAPDFTSPELTLAPMLITGLMDTAAGQEPKPDEPFAPFVIGSNRFLPHYDNVFTKADAISIVATIYGAPVDKDGKAQIVAGYSISRDGVPVAKGTDETFTTADAVPAVGPIPLATYKPGKYTVVLKVTDNLSKKDYKEEGTFELR
jgi:GWxTD domain-containing protein